jgi:hypothetical protein
MDRTHVRLTTSGMIRQWFEEVGLTEVAVFHRSSRRRERLIMACTFGLTREFLARQLFFEARKPH